MTSSSCTTKCICTGIDCARILKFRYVNLRDFLTWKTQLHLLSGYGRERGNKYLVEVANYRGKWRERGNKYLVEVANYRGKWRERGKPNNAASLFLDMHCLSPWRVIRLRNTTLGV